MNIVTLLSLVSSTIVLANCHFHTLIAEPSAHLISQAAMASTNVYIKSITLLARERKKDFFSGSPPQPNRDIGFASVFIRIENPQEENANLIIQSIQIRNASDGQVQMTSQAPEEIHLKPLENYENVFSLTNKTGYSGHNRVKAVVTYKVQGRVQVIESSSVEIDRL
ncbi:MAG: hypothetical protein Fur006_55930 [Coleofasciculaceae cyanobacterium]